MPINWSDLMNQSFNTKGAPPSPVREQPPPPSSPTNIAPAIAPVGSASIPGGAFGMSPSGPGLYGLMQQLDKYVYSVPAGGYLTEAEARNANSYYNKFGAGGGGDPAANAAARRIYGVIGDLPTVANTSPALAKLNAAAGIQPTQGPSLNSQLAALLQGPNAQALRDAGFGGRWEGPWQFGRRNPDYNMWGQYHPDNQYS